MGGRGVKYEMGASKVNTLMASSIIKGVAGKKAKAIQTKINKEARVKEYDKAVKKYEKEKITQAKQDKIAKIKQDKINAKELKMSKSEKKEFMKTFNAEEYGKAIEAAEKEAKQEAEDYPFASEW